MISHYTNMTTNHLEISSDEEEADCNNSELERTILVYNHATGKVELPLSSLRCLDSDAFLNDNIIQFYLSYLKSDICSRSIATRVHVFDSIFFEHLDTIFRQEDVDQNKLRQLRVWYDGVDIFEKDFLIIPVCSQMHWVVIVICYPCNVKSLAQRIEQLNQTKELQSSANQEDKVPGIVVMDSLRMQKRTNITMTIRDFLDYEWRFRGKELKRFSHQDIKEYFPLLPRQKNYVDCGLYVLSYVRSFLEDPDLFYKLVRDPTMTDSKTTLKNIVKNHIEDDAREKLKSLIHETCEKHISSH